MAIAATAVLLSALIGCAESERRTENAQQSAPADGVSSQAPTVPAATSGSDGSDAPVRGIPGQPRALREVSRQQVDVPAGTGAVRLNDRSAYFVVHRYSENTSGLYEWDFDSRTPRVVVPFGWLIGQVELDQRHLAWVETDLMQTDALEPMSWRIKVMDLGTHRIRTLIKSGKRTRLAPDIMLDGDTLYYSTWRGFDAGTTDTHALDLRSGRDRIVVRNLPTFPQLRIGPALLGGMTTNRGKTPAESRSDLFVINDRPPRQLTRNGFVYGAQYSDGVLLWHSCRGGDCHVFAQTWPSGSATELLHAEDPVPILGKGFVAIYTHAGGIPTTTLLPMGAPDRPLTLTPPPGRVLIGDVQAHHHLLAWVVAEDEHPDRGKQLLVSTIEPSDEPPTN